MKFNAVLVSLEARGKGEQTYIQKRRIQRWEDRATSQEILIATHRW
jgi:hypothetical protein